MKHEKTSQMRRTTKALAALVLGAAILLSPRIVFGAGTQVVGDGETFEMTSIPGTDVQADFNVYASYIDCSGSCTVKILNDGGVDVRPRFRLAANTVLTLDLTARSGEGLGLKGSGITDAYQRQHLALHHQFATFYNKLLGLRR